MQGPFATPDDLAAALLRGPVTATRIKKLLVHASRGSEAEFERVLAALPDDVRARVRQAATATQFAG